jgi:hypothetical protein
VFVYGTRIDKTDALIPHMIPFDYGPGAISRSAVHHQDLSDFFRLGDETVETIAYARRFIQHRKDDTDTLASRYV